MRLTNVDKPGHDSNFFFCFSLTVSFLHAIRRKNRICSDHKDSALSFVCCFLLSTKRVQNEKESSSEFQEARGQEDVSSMISPSYGDSACIDLCFLHQIFLERHHDSAGETLALILFFCGASRSGDSVE